MHSHCVPCFLPTLYCSSKEQPWPEPVVCPPQPLLLPVSLLRVRGLWLRLFWYHGQCGLCQPEADPRCVRFCGARWCKGEHASWKVSGRQWVISVSLCDGKDSCVKWMHTELHRICTMHNKFYAFLHPTPYKWLQHTFHPPPHTPTPHTQQHACPWSSPWRNSTEEQPGCLVSLLPPDDPLPCCAAVVWPSTSDLPCLTPSTVWSTQNPNFLMALFFGQSCCQMLRKCTHRLHNQFLPLPSVGGHGVCNALDTTVHLIPPVTQTCRIPPRTLKPGDRVGYFRPQLGFTPPSQSRTYGTPDNVQRIISGSLSNPKLNRQFPQGRSSQQLSWQSFDDPHAAAQRAWSMQAPPRPRPSYPAYGGGGRGGYGGPPPEDRRNGEIWLQELTGTSIHSHRTFLLHWQWQQSGYGHLVTQCGYYVCVYMYLLLLCIQCILLHTFVHVHVV